MKFFASFLLVMIITVSVVAQDDFVKGKEALNRQAYDEAIPLFQKYLSANSRNVEANYFLGEAYLLKGDLKNAQSALERTLDFNDEYEPALASIVRVYGKLGMWDKAMKSFNAAAKYHKKGILVPLAYAQTFLELDSLDKASIYFSKVKELDDKNVEAYVGLSEVYARQNVIVLAVENLRTATQLKPTDPTLWYKLGATILKNRALNSDQIRELTEALQKSIDLDPKNDKAIFDAANTFYRIKYWREAAGFFKKYIELKKDNAEAWEKYAMSAYNARAYSDAIPALEQAIKMNPNTFELKPMLANAYFFTQEYKKALDAFKIIPQDSLSKDDYYWIGLSHFRTKDTVNAIKNFEIANVKDTSVNVAAGDLAAIYINQRKYDKALEQYEKLLAKDPDNLTALFYAGYSCSVLDQIEPAKYYFKKFIKLRPTNVQARISLGNMYSLQDSVKEGTEQFNIVIALSDSMLKAEPAKAAQHSQSLISAYRSLGMFDYKNKNFKGAVANLLKAVSYEQKNKPDESLHLFLAQMYAVSLGDPELLASEAQVIKKKSCEEYKLVLKINPKNATAKKELVQLNCDK